MKEQDYLAEALEELGSEFTKHGIKLLVAGGFSQYLKTGYCSIKRSRKYKYELLQRSTKDLDIVLTGDIVADESKFKAVRDILDSLNYEPITKYYQFSKKVDLDGIKRVIQVDILTEPPDEKTSSEIYNKKPPRIRHRSVKNLHAFEHKEAERLSKYCVEISSILKPDTNFHFRNIFIPSVLSYIIMKLHAFRDRTLKNEAERSSHHAFDIFSAVIYAGEADWSVIEKQKQDSELSVLITESNHIREKYFNEIESEGIMMIRSNPLFKKKKEIYQDYLKEVITDLRDMLN